MNFRMCRAASTGLPFTAADTFITFRDDTRAYLETALDSISVVLLPSG
jgi:hypothetical protein